MVKIKSTLENKIICLIGSTVTISSKIKHSPTHTHEYAGRVGILTSYDAGKSPNTFSVEVVVEVTFGKKAPRIEQMRLWIDARDLVELQS